MSKIFGQLSVQNENVQASIDEKNQMISALNEYSDQFEKYAQNYILVPRDTIVDAAEQNLRPFIEPIEQRERAISANQQQRQIELREAEAKLNEVSEQFQRESKINTRTEELLSDIFNRVQNKLNQMEHEGYA